jgi:hypothetical protein
LNKTGLIVILAVNTLVWMTTSALHYIGFYIRMEKDYVNLIVWSILVFSMYLLIIYALSLTIARYYSIFRYRNYKIKYMNKTFMRKQQILLVIVIIYLYVICYWNTEFLGFIPMIFFFGKQLTHLGKFYIIQDNYLILQDEYSREYVVKEMNLQECRLILQHRFHYEMKVLWYKMGVKEIDFLINYSKNKIESREVA